jgi:hypothetical protein
MTKKFGHQPRNIAARHLCGNTWCVKISHIVPGRYGSGLPGIRDVAKIRHLVAEGTLTYEQIAAAFGTTQETVSAIARPAEPEI